MTAEIIPLKRRVWGATREQWTHFELVVGAADLLPVVSNPEAQISEQSTLKGKGKTPSIYNQQRRVVGLPKWTQRIATSGDIERWSRESDYGLCIQTRRVRGLDIDIADADLADRVGEVFRSALGLASDTLPARSRADTGKVLLAFELVGSFPKRSFKVDGGLVEFLANGQQFIAIGEHFRGDGEPSGTRYEWPDGLPDVFPTVTQTAFERAWTAIVEQFALEPAQVGDVAQSRHRADIDGAEDPVAEYLDEQGLIIGASGEKLFVTCPWKDGHTADSGVSETCWLMAGTKGFQRGHFQCMHASCAKRSDDDFLDAIGYRTAAFKDLGPGGGDAASRASQGPESPGGESEPQPWPTLKRDGNGRIEASLGNLERMLARPDLCGMEVRFDTFRDALMVQEGSGPNAYLRPFADADGVSIRIALEAKGFKPIGRETFRDALMVHARDNSFDSAQDWLSALPAWDGVERIETSFPRLFAAADSEYTRAVGRYAWTALAGRVMDPGCKADMAIVLQGPQGILKSTAVAAIAPDREMFREISLHALDADLSRKLRGCVVAEMAELKGLKGRESEAIKAWIAQQEERWVPKWQERETAFQRRCVLWGTSNPAEILDDETGERRWLPVACQGRLDVAAIVAQRDQLWAEGLFRWRMLGIEWQDAERLAKAEHHKFKVRDIWSDAVSQWLDQPLDVSQETANGRGWVRLIDVAQGALSREASRLSRPDELRLGRVMRGLGWRSQGHRVDGKPLWCWVKVECEGGVSPE